MEILDKEDYEYSRMEESDKVYDKTFVATEYLDKKKYVKASLYYLKAYLGIRECVIFALFLAFAITYACVFLNFLPLVFVGVVVVLIAFTVLITYLTTVSGYKMEYEVREIAYQKLTINGEKLVAESFKKGCEKLYEEEFLVTRIKKIALKKDAIYFYPVTGVVYYVERDSVEGATFEELVSFLRLIFPPTTFKLRKKVKTYPDPIETK